MLGLPEPEGQGLSKPTVKQHLAALRMLFDWLVVGHVLDSNLAHAVRGPKYSQKKGEVANNYNHGGKSFKEAMHGLETAAKKIADGYLHSHIRQSESLPTAQQVYFAAQLDLLLGEIVRMT